SASLLLFLVMDPFGNIPFFISALKNVDPKRYKKIIIRELLIALIVLMLFLFFGHYILKVLGISEPSLTISGGIILFLIAIKMIFPRPGGHHEEDVEGEPFIVPLAIPYVAGPSAMAAILLITSQEPGRWPEWMLALLLTWFVSGLIIFSSTFFIRFLGKRGLIAIERLMGMILITISVQMLMTGIVKFIKVV
ncbi:MAG: NAAT family transporter, partial [Candidatus Aminicenantes bacterium]|nr:NAAT family transporter [Candidatus Aminicenantes bacterium]